MSKFLKRLLFVVPMIICLFALGATNQEANSKRISTDGAINAYAEINKIEEPAPLVTGGSILEQYCDEVEVLYIPPIFGFGGIMLGFGTGCGADSDENCVGAVQGSSGKLVVHLECEQAEEEEGSN